MLHDAQLAKQRELIARAQKDPQVFGEIFDAHYKMILNYVVRRTSDVAIAEDITSLTFLKAMNNLGTFRWQGVPISAWLYRIAGNEIRTFYRKHKHNLSLDELYQQDGYEPAAETDLEEELSLAQERLERNQDYRRLQTALLTLPVKYQEVVVLKYGENKKLSEIAAILGKKEGTVKSLLSRALDRLCKAMKDQKTQPFRDARIMHSEGRFNKPRERT